MAHDARVRTAARRLRDQQPEPDVRYFEGDAGVRDQHSDRETGETGRCLRQCIGPADGQIQGFRPDAGGGFEGRGAADRRVLRQPRMQGHRFVDGEQVPAFHPRSDQGLDRPVGERPAHDPPSWIWRVHGGRQDDQAAVESEIGGRRSSAAEGLSMFIPR